MAKTGTFLMAANPAGLATELQSKLKNPRPIFTAQFLSDIKNNVPGVKMVTIYSNASGTVATFNYQGNLYEVKISQARYGSERYAHPKGVKYPKNPDTSKNPVKYWILDPAGNVKLTITKGGREKAEKIAAELGKGFSVVGFGVDDNERSPYAANPAEKIKIGTSFAQSGHNRGKLKANIYLINGYAYAKSAYAAKTDYNQLEGDLKNFVRVNAGRSGNEVYFYQVSGHGPSEQHKPYQY